MAGLSAFPLAGGSVIVRMTDNKGEFMSAELTCEQAANFVAHVIHAGRRSQVVARNIDELKADLPPKNKPIARRIR